MTNKKEMILKEINSNPYLAMEALETIYHNRTYAIIRYNKVDKFYKTKRGAEGYVKRQSNISWYDDYTQEMVTAVGGTIVEIQADEIMDPTTNKKIWYDYIKKYWHIDFRFENIIHEAKEIITDNELLKWVENIIKDIEETDSFLWIEEFEDVEQIENVKAINEDVKEVEKILKVPEVQNKNNEPVEISFNEEKNGIEIKFDNKPPKEVLENLKVNGFRWSRYQKIWYAKDTEERREFIKQFENSTITEAEPKIFEYPDIDIDDLDNYKVNERLSKRESQSSWIFRTKERNHSQEIKDILEEYQIQAIEILNLTDDKESIYYIKRDLQRFKKAYHSNYIARLTNKANNPSWAVTGSSGRNARKDQRAMDRYDNLMKESIELVESFERNLYRHKSRIRKAARKKKYEDIENTDIEIDFKVETKEIEFLNVKQKVRTYNYENYMIAKLWGCYRIFKDGKEIKNLRTTDTLTIAKKVVQWLINKELQEIQEAI